MLHSYQYRKKVAAEGTGLPRPEFIKQVWVHDKTSTGQLFKPEDHMRPVVIGDYQPVLRQRDTSPLANTGELCGTIVTSELTPTREYQLHLLDGKVKMLNDAPDWSNHPTRRVGDIGSFLRHKQ